MGSRTGFSDDRAVARRVAGPKSAVRDYAETLLLCCIAIFFLRAFVFQQSEIPSGSMEQTLLIGDHILVNRFVHARASTDWERRLLPIREIERGEVIVFQHPPEPEQDYIKRVIGLPGERIDLRGGVLYVDGRRVEEPYLTPAERTEGDFGPVIVAPDSFFVLGDHRSQSADSRVWGLVPRALVKGRAFLVLFSTASPRPPADRTGRVSPVTLLRKAYDLVFHSRWDRALSAIR